MINEQRKQELQRLAEKQYKKESKPKYQKVETLPLKEQVYYYNYLNTLFGFPDNKNIPQIDESRKRIIEKIAQKDCEISRKDTKIKLQRQKLTEKQQLREKQLREAYKKNKDEIYFNFIKEQHLTEWHNSHGTTVDGRRLKETHNLYVPQITSAHPLYESIKVFTEDNSDLKRLKEEFSYKTIIENSINNDPARNSKALKECIKLSKDGIPLESDGIF